MHYTSNAGHSCGNRQGCLEGTRKEVLRDIERWLASERDQRVFWLNGLAGTGKSTIAQTFADTTFADGKLGVSFFCSRDFEDRSNLQRIFPTLAFQLACKYPHFRTELLRVLKERPNAGQESLCSQMEKLIVGPLKVAQISTLIIIDALDECKDEEPASAILSILSRQVDLIPAVKFFITGRPEPRIRSGFRLESLAPITEVLKLHEVKPEAVDRDIGLFFQTQLANLSRDRSDFDLTEDWPSPSDVKILCKKAAGFFIYASTVVKFVASESDPPTERLVLITSLPESTIEEGKSGVDQLYSKVLQQAFSHIHSDNHQQYLHFQTVVGAVLFLFNPLSIKGLSELMDCTTQRIRNTVRSLHSLLLIPENVEDSIQIFHKSFPDFLTNPDRCQDRQLLMQPASNHTKILLACLRFMEKRLKKNICNLDDYAVPSKVKDFATHKKAYIGDGLEYACQFWTRHLLGISSSGPHIEEVQKRIDKFFRVHLLHWIEVLVLTGHLSVGVYAMNDIEQWYNMVGFVLIFLLRLVLIVLQIGIESKWANDSQRLLLEYFDIFQSSPSHIYHSALPLLPSSSWPHTCYSTEPTVMVKAVKGLLAGWGKCTRTVLLDGYTRTLSYHNNTIAISSKHGDIFILNVITGSQMALFSGHTSEVNSLMFSSDGTLLVSGSDDKAIKLWDVQTGGVIKTFSGHTHLVWTVSLSADCTTIASGSRDDTIRLWNTKTGKCYYTHKMEDADTVNSVSFSPTDPQHLISIVDGSGVLQWDANGHQIKHPSEGSCAAFSSDGALFALCHGVAVTVQNSNSGTVVVKFQLASSNSKCCCFSPDSRFVAVAVSNTISVWDISSDPHLVETFLGHAYDISALVFSSPSSLISASFEGSVKFWQIGILSSELAAVDPESTPTTLPLVSSISLKARAGVAISSGTAGEVKTWDILTSDCKAPSKALAKYCRHGDTKLTNNRLIFVWYIDEGISVWDAGKEGFLLQVNAPEDTIVDLRISGDGSKLFYIHCEFIRAWDIWTGEMVGEVEYKELDGVELLAMDGSRVWIKVYDEASISMTSRGWDFRTSGLSSIEEPTVPPKELYLSNTKLWDTGLCRIVDTVTGKIVFQLPAQFGTPIDIKWNSQYLFTSFQSKMELILEFHPAFFE